MAITTYNPYSADVDLLSNGLDYIIANVPSSPTVYDLLDTCEAYLYTLIPGAPANVGIGMKIALTNVLNSYIDGKIEQNLSYDPSQLALVNSVYDGIRQQSIDSLGDFFADSAQQLAMAEYSTYSKGPMYYALMEAEVSYYYWLGKIGAPGGWATYLNSNAAINYSNIPYWVSAAYVAAFAGWSLGQDVNLNYPIPTTQPGIAVMLPKFSAMLSALFLTSGEVILGFSNRPTLNKNF